MAAPDVRRSGRCSGRAPHRPASLQQSRAVPGPEIRRGDTPALLGGWPTASAVGDTNRLVSQSACFGATIASVSLSNQGANMSDNRWTIEDWIGLAVRLFFGALLGALVGVSWIWWVSAVENATVNGVC